MSKKRFEKLYYYARLMRWHRPIGIFLLLWPTWWALWLASHGAPNAKLILVFSLAVFVMRSAGCVINDYADQHIDGKITRTKDRPLVTEKVSSKEAFVIFSVLIFIAFLLVLTLHTFTIALAFIGLLLASAYPFTKRYTYYPQFFLALAYSWAIVMAFSAQTNNVPFSAWLLFLANVCWTMAYDSMYAMTDRPDDLKNNVKSTAVIWGKYETRIIAILQASTLLLLITVGIIYRLPHPYYIGLIAAGGLAAYQQYLIKDRIPANCFQAFLNNNWFGAVVFIGLLWGYAVI